MLKLSNILLVIFFIYLAIIDIEKSKVMQTTGNFYTADDEPQSETS